MIESLFKCLKKFVFIQNSNKKQQKVIKGSDIKEQNKDNKQSNAEEVNNQLNVQ
jgi:hypothetical protein